MNPFLLLLSILLWLGAINTNTTYTQSQIYAIEAQNQPQVNQVYSDEELESDIWNEYNDDAQRVDVSDWNPNQ